MTTDELLDLGPDEDPHAAAARLAEGKREEAPKAEPEQDEVALEEQSFLRKAAAWDQPAPYGLQEDGSFRLKLLKPIRIGQSDDARVLEELHYREPRGKDWVNFPVEPKRMGQIMAFGGLLAAEPMAVISLLRGKDAVRHMEVAGAFFGGAPEMIGRGLQAT